MTTFCKYCGDDDCSDGDYCGGRSWVRDEEAKADYCGSEVEQRPN